MTFLQAQQQFQKYVSPEPYSSGNSARIKEVINLVSQRLLESGYWKDSLFESTLTSDSSNIITLPSSAQSIAAVLDPKSQSVGTQFSPYRNPLIPQTPTTYLAPHPNKSYRCLLTRKFSPYSSDSDVLIIDNPNALRYAIQAFMYDEANDLERAKVYWDQAYLMLENENQKQTIGQDANLTPQVRSAVGCIRNLI